MRLRTRTSAVHCCGPRTADVLVRNGPRAPIDVAIGLPRRASAHLRVARGLFALILLDAQVAYQRLAAVAVVYEADAGHERFDDVDLLQWRDDQKLQVESFEQFQPVARRFVRAAAEGFVDDHEAE